AGRSQHSAGILVLRFLALGCRLLFALMSCLVCLPLARLVMSGRLPLCRCAFLRNGGQGLAGFRVGLALRAGHEFLLRADPLMTKADHVAVGSRAVTCLLLNVGPLELRHLYIGLGAFSNCALRVFLPLTGKGRQAAADGALNLAALLLPGDDRCGILIVSCHWRAG